MEMLFNTLPAFSLSYKVNSAFRHACNYCQRMGAHAFSKKFSDVNNLFTCQFVRGLLLAFNPNKTRLPGVLRVSGKANPFKINRSVVGLVSVDMVDAKPILEASAVGKSNQPMSQHAHSSTIGTHVYTKVSSVVDLWRIRLLWNVLCHRLFNTQSNSAVGHVSSGNLDISKRTYDERNSIVFKWFPAFHNSPPVSHCASITGGSL